MSTPGEGDKPLVTEEGKTPAKQTLPQMLEAIQNEILTDPQENLSNPVLVIAMEIITAYERDRLDVEYAEWALGTLDGEEQVQALRAAQSVIGAGKLRQAIYPTLEELVSEIVGGSESQPYGILDPEVIRVVEFLRILDSQERLTQNVLIEALDTLPRRNHKKTVIVDLQMVMEGKRFLSLVGR